MKVLLIRHDHQIEGDPLPLVRLLNEEIARDGSEHYAQLPERPQPIVVRNVSKVNEPEAKKSAPAKRKQDNVREERQIPSHPRFVAMDQQFAEETRMRRAEQVALRRELEKQRIRDERAIRQQEEELLLRRRAERLNDHLGSKSERTRLAPRRRPNEEETSTRMSARSSVRRPQAEFIESRRVTASNPRMLDELRDEEEIRARHSSYRETLPISQASPSPRRATVSHKRDEPTGTAAVEEPRRRVLLGSRSHVVVDDRPPLTSREELRPRIRPSSTALSPGSSPTLSPFRGRRGLDDEIRPRPVSPSSASPVSSPGRSMMSSSNDEWTTNARMGTRKLDFQQADRRRTEGGRAGSLMESLELDSTGTATDSEDLGAVLRSRQTRLNVMKVRLQQIYELTRDNPEREKLFENELIHLNELINELSQPFQRKTKERVSAHNIQPPPPPPPTAGDEEEEKEETFMPQRRARGRAFDIRAENEEEARPEKQPLAPVKLQQDETLEEPQAVLSEEDQFTSNLERTVMDGAESFTDEADRFVYPTYDWAPFVREYIYHLIGFSADEIVHGTAAGFQERTSSTGLVIALSAFEEIEDKVVGQAGMRRIIFDEVNVILEEQRAKNKLPGADYATHELSQLTDTVTAYLLASDKVEDFLEASEGGDSYKSRGRMTYGEIGDYVYRLLRHSIRNFQSEGYVIVPEESDLVEQKIVHLLRSQRHGLFLAANQALLDLYPGFTTQFQPPFPGTSLKSFVYYGRRPQTDDMRELAEEITQRILRFDVLQVPGADMAPHVAREIGETIGRRLIQEEERGWQEFFQEENELAKSIGEDAFGRLTREVDVETERVFARVQGIVPRPEDDVVEPGDEHKETL